MTIHVRSFPPIAMSDAHALILGTMPSKVSLREQQYYAHPQNAFWRIVGEILGFDAASPYESRTRALASAGFALWDVLKSCQREGSLDSDIDSSTLVPNDFAAFFASHRQIRCVFFNGAKAEALYMRHVRLVVANGDGLEYVRLPSTSPANASIPIAAKLCAWRRLASDR